MPATDPNQVLSSNMLKEINKGLSAIDKAIGQCDIAEGCSVDCGQRRIDLEDLRQQLNTFKATYFPGAK